MAYKMKGWSGWSSPFKQHAGSDYSSSIPSDDVSSSSKKWDPKAFGEDIREKWQTFKETDTYKKYSTAVSDALTNYLLQRASQKEEIIDPAESFSKMQLGTDKKE